ncbi:MAG: DUF2461 domain-containing protein [Planctomycetota bacterium]
MPKRSARQSPISNRLFAFIEELQDNNDRDWFASNKARYEEDVQRPTLELIEQLSKPMARSAPMLRVVAKKTGGSLMRIYRDTRFSKDKTPYKTNVGISMRHDANQDIHAPGMYLHLATDECFLGAGCWRPERRSLAAIRAAIDADSKSWIRARNNKTLNKFFQLAGESLKTSPRDYAKDHPMIEDLRRIDFIGVSPLTKKQLMSADAIDHVMERVKAAKPLMRFLCDAVHVPY